MELTQALLQLDAAAEPSRLRLLVALLSGETTVGDLTGILEQSQPRVSRHLRLLVEAGLVESFREGRSIYYRWSPAGLEAGIASSVAALAASRRPDHCPGSGAPAPGVRAARTGCTAPRPAGRAHPWPAQRWQHSRIGGVLMRRLLGPAPLGGISCILVGCGSGDLLRALLPATHLAVGTEPSVHRRQVARSRLRDSGLPRWTHSRRRGRPTCPLPPPLLTWCSLRRPWAPERRLALPIPRRCSPRRPGCCVRQAGS